MTKDRKEGAGFDRAEEAQATPKVEGDASSDQKPDNWRSIGDLAARMVRGQIR
jgi:hypothetical protein